MNDVTNPVLALAPVADGSSVQSAEVAVGREGCHACDSDKASPLLPPFTCESLSSCYELRQVRDRLEALFDGVETGIFVIDPQTHRIVDANPVAVALVGAPIEKIRGAVCHKFVCPAETGRCPVTDLGQTVDNSERTLLTASGEKRAIIKTVRSVDMGDTATCSRAFSISATANVRNRASPNKLPTSTRWSRSALWASSCSMNPGASAFRTAHWNASSSTRTTN